MREALEGVFSGDLLTKCSVRTWVVGELGIRSY